LLAEAGLDVRDLLRITLYLTSYDDFAEINAIYRERLHEPYPARVTLQVAGLSIGVESSFIRRLGAGRCHAARTRRALSRSSFARP